MLNWRLVLWGDLWLALIVATFVTILVGSATTNLAGADLGLVTGLVAGVLTFIAGARMAFRIALGLRDLRRLPDALDRHRRPDGSRVPLWARDSALTEILCIVVGIAVLLLANVQLAYPIGELRGLTPFVLTVLIGAVGMAFGTIRLIQRWRAR